MLLRLVLRTVAARPVRAAVLACGFGSGIAVMATLLGVGEVVLEQARAPALRGGGDLVVGGATGRIGSARFVLQSVLGTPPIAGRVAAASPSVRANLYLFDAQGRAHPVRARGGIPSLEKALGDREVGAAEAWVDTPRDRSWTHPAPGDVLRAMDYFHPVPDVPARASAWAEWLYFNGRSGDGRTRFYVTLLVGPAVEPGLRRAGVRLQLDRDGRTTSYAAGTTIREDVLLKRAPDLDLDGTGVRLEGTAYRIDVDLPQEGRPAVRARGTLRLHGTPGRSVPPFSIRGAGGWVSGYTVPVLSGEVEGELRVGDDVVSLAGGTGYHDHNWGFWRGVSWRWGQVAHGGLSLVYGRVHPPRDAADPERLPGFLVAIGPEGPLGFAREVVIEQTDAAPGRPQEVRVRAHGAVVDLELVLEVEGAVRTPMGGPWTGPQGRTLTFLQLRGTWRVRGTVAGRTVDFTSAGAAETFVGD